MNQSDSCQSQAKWSVTVQRTWSMLHVEENALKLTLTSGILKSKLGKKCLMIFLKIFF